jgi:hypothetical protein
MPIKKTPDINTSEHYKLCSHLEKSEIKDLAAVALAQIDQTVIHHNPWSARARILPNSAMRMSAGDSNKPTTAAQPNQKDPFLSESEISPPRVPSNASDTFEPRGMYSESGPQLTPTSIRWISALAVLIGIFSLGAAVGLFTTSWLNKNTNHAPALLGKLTKQAINAALPKPKGRPADSLTGVDAGELPYDGNPFPKEEESTIVAATLPAINADTSLQDMKTISGSVAEATSNEGESVESPILDSGEQATAGKVQKTGPIPPPFSSQIQSVPRPMAKVKPSQQNRLPPKVVKDSEIDRINQQAADELKKKTDSGMANAVRKPKKPKNVTSTAAKQTNKQLLLAKCEQASNFFLKERCRWQLCSGTWGKGGCPSYEKQSSLF